MEEKKESVETLEKDNQKRAKRNRLTRNAFFLFCLVGIIAFAIWWVYYRHYESTDDAYINGNMIVLTSRQQGVVKAYYVDNNDLVQMGQLIIQLDPTDYLLEFDHKKATLALTARNVRNLYEQVKQAQANIVLREATYNKALIDYESRLPLVDSEAISGEEFDHVEAQFKVEKASLKLAIYQLDAAKAALGDTPMILHPMIEEAKAALRNAYLGVVRCWMKAPMSGYIAKRTVQEGMPIKTTTPLLAIVPLDAVWVDANFKETQLKNIRIGQSVNVHADMYGKNILYHGKVGGISAGSGSVFSVLPAQNASGNWIKVIQRIPVRVYLDNGEVENNPLLLGLSAYVSVDTSNKSGMMLQNEPAIEEAIGNTDIFDISMEELDRVIEEIIRSNLTINEPLDKR